MPSSRRSSQPRDRTQISHTTGRFFTIWATREAQKYWSGLTFPFLVNHVLSELFTVTCLSWVALHSMTHSFIELCKPFCHNKTVIHKRDEEKKVKSEVSQCLWDPMDYSLRGSTVHGIFQTRILEWVAISFSRGSSWPRDQTQISCIIGRCFTIWATREAQKGWIVYRN